MREMRLILACAIGCAVLTGCATSGPRQEPSYFAGQVSGALVTSANWHVGWEYDRNDPPERDIRLPHYVVEVRHRETLRTINGRPREYTTTRSRSIHWRRSP